MVKKIVARVACPDGKLKPETESSPPAGLPIWNVYLNRVKIKDPETSESARYIA